ncbi:uncharacterized protein EKO05_0000091 [Ascochyta rabiei]|uniref:TMEM205-like domain-containing protein n=1 Tax=Didymella rabiei TaxID=5454 RepID=A0A163CF81_DIDRA|nr:uncharacterized protein EKO05_0000091 [Ascochyta rabiei]KZM22418.1 hypothetical protein ST47_g6458 [Ascochyta rabiei]UPX09401.1 hypothetical protein EKO05_0000091 [Ascochyta rabiei]
MPTTPVVAMVMAPIHLLTYSALLGTELYQSFIMTKVAFQALPRSAFTSLQKRVFPIYFKSQSLLLILVALTLPPYGPASVVHNKSDWVPLVIAGGTAALNLSVYGPRTLRFMVERVHQTTRDSKPLTDSKEISVEMKRLNRLFSKAHAMSIHLNLISIIATLCYGWRLSSKLSFEAA